MAEWEKNDVPENGESPAGGHHEAPPDLSFEMPNNIAALSQDASWAEQPSEQEPSSEETAPGGGHGLPRKPYRRRRGPLPLTERSWGLRSGFSGF